MLVSRIAFTDSVSLLSAGGAQSQARLPELQALARNAGEMAQLINCAVQLNTRLIHRGCRSQLKSRVVQARGRFLREEDGLDEMKLCPSPASYYIQIS